MLITTHIAAVATAQRQLECGVPVIDDNAVANGDGEAEERVSLSRDRKLATLG